jgi:DNA processing protein
MAHEPWLALCLASDLGPAGIRKLLERFGTAAGIISASRQELLESGLSATLVTQIHNPDETRLDTALNWLQAADHHLVHWQDERYPELLRAAGHSPPVLFVCGDPDVLGLPQIAIIGSRNATPGGLEIATNFATHLAHAGLTITSGLAAGIDSAAHQGALAADGITIAVMGTGPDQIYPRDNTALARRIMQNGALVTEFPPGMPANRENFPQRNRIISGLCLGTLVVEAGIRSGSLITARYSGEYGREVFAVPGSIHSPVSKGCHKLIQQGAKLVQSSADIIEELAALAASINTSEMPIPEGIQPSDQVDPEYAKLLCSMGFDPVNIPTLAKRCGLTAGELSSMLLILELEGKVQTLPGGHFQQLTGWNRTNE